LFFIGFIYISLIASSAAISEKWRIRQEWGKQNWKSLTEREQKALCADGANLVMGPFIFGGAYSFCIFGATLLVSTVCRRIILKKKSQQKN